MEIVVSEDMLAGTRITTAQSFNRGLFNLDSLLSEYRASKKSDPSEIRESLIDAFSHQEIILGELERNLPEHYSQAVVYSLEVGSQVGLEHLVSSSDVTEGRTTGLLNASGINFELQTPNPVTELKKKYMKIAKDVVRCGGNLHQVTAEFFKWINDRAKSLESNIKYAQLNLFLQKNPVIIGHRTFDRVDDQLTLPSQVIKGFVWDSVGGYEDQKKTLIRVAQRIKNIEQASLYMENPIPRGILMYGPSGTGKTLIASTFSYQSGLPFMNVQAASLGSAYVNETANRWQKEVFDKAKSYVNEGLSPGCVVFVDEIDRVCPDRQHMKPGEDSKVLGVFFENMYGNLYVPGVLVIAATNRAYVLDSALLSRFDPILEIGFPATEELEQVYSICFQRAEVHSARFSDFERGFMADLDYRRLAKSSEGLTGRNVYDIINGIVGEHLDAYLETREAIKPIQMQEVVDKIESYKSDNTLKIKKNQADYQQSREFLAQLV